nr:hypothetical protein XAC3615_4360002 [Xanthomonas citri pv. citri]CEH62299.1 hypothetical protein XACLD7_4700002 [Xanthomonas citri pv. citri]CEL44082.1 hypothetical protein XAC439_3880002 [Xanthomonas citri pv. citri]
MGGQAGKIGFLERAGAHVPAVGGAVVADQACQHAVFAGQPGQIFRLQRRGEIRERIADQQRVLVPVIAQETLDRHTQRLSRTGLDFDGKWGRFTYGHVGSLHDVDRECGARHRPAPMAYCRLPEPDVHLCGAQRAGSRSPLRGWPAIPIASSC